MFEKVKINFVSFDTERRRDESYRDWVHSFAYTRVNRDSERTRPQLSSNTNKQIKE